MTEREEYNRKMKLYKKLGAVKFQKVVFAVERAKFKILKKICPNFLKYYDKFCERNRKKELKKATTEKEKKEINRKYKSARMATYKEFHQEKNRNYHLNEKNPAETYEFLKWNKKVHKRNLILNAIAMPFLTVGLFFFPAVAAPLLAIEVFKAIINFECINIQNYNMCRYKKAEKALLRRAEKKVEKEIEEYPEAIKHISKKVEESTSVPTIEEVIDGIENPEQLKELKNLILAIQRERKIEREMEKSRGNNKCQH